MQNSPIDHSSLEDQSQLEHRNIAAGANWTLDGCEREADGYFWKELRLGEYRVWLRGGVHYERSWEYGFQHCPLGRVHGPMLGPIFQPSPPELIGGLDAVLDLLVRDIWADSLARRAKPTNRLRSAAMETTDMTAPITAPQVSSDTKLAQALALHPNVLEYIISLGPHDFERLRHTVMRKLMSPRISLGRVALMAGVPINTLLEHIAALGSAVAVYSETITLEPQVSSVRPAWVANADPTRTRIVNLLPLDDALSEDPLPPVMLEVKKLRPGEWLLIRHRWEPQPFYDIWAKLPGLEWYAQAVSHDEWQIWLRRC